MHRNIYGLYAYRRLISSRRKQSCCLPWPRSMQRFGSAGVCQAKLTTRQEESETNVSRGGGGGWPPDIVFDISYRLRIRHDWQTDGDGPGSWTIGE